MHVHVDCQNIKYERAMKNESEQRLGVEKTTFIPPFIMQRISS